MSVFSFGLRWVAAALLALGLASGVAVAQSGPRNGAEAFIQQNVDRGYDILTNDRLPQNERQRRFRSFLLGLIDARRIAQFTLGRYANDASNAELDDFTDAFANYIVAVYQDRLSQYRDQTLQVTGSNSRGEDDVVVNADIIDRAHSEAKPFHVAFRVREGNGGRYVITDLNVEGIWQSISERADFTAFLQQHRGRIVELTNDLIQKTRALRS